MPHRDDRPSPIQSVAGARSALTARPMTESSHRQNDVGDVVIPVENGEIVALPRLWDFRLEVVGSHGAVLRAAGGLTATVRFSEDTVVVDHVSGGAVGIRRTAREVA